MKFLSAFRFLCVAVGVMTLLSACRTPSASVTQVDAVPVICLSDEDQRRFDYYFLEATRLKLRGDYAPAYEMIRHCLAIHPQSSSALYEQAQYLLMLKQEEKATRSLEAAVRFAPDNYWYSQALCNFYLQSNDTTGKARRLLESMSIRFPNKPDVLYTLMELYNRNGEYSRVIDVLNRLEQKLGKSEQLSMEKFRMYLQLQDMKNAFREIESLVAEYPKDPRYKVVLGDIYLENKKPEQAYRLYQEALTDEPDNALALYSLANYYDEMGMEEQYKHQLDTLLMNRKVPAATKTEVMRRIVVQSEKEQADSTKVINLFERVLQQEPDDASLPMLYAQYLYTKGMKKEMIPVLNRVIDIDPGNTSARSNLIAEAVKAEDYHEIIRLCETGVEVNPERIDFYFYLAIAYVQAERNEEVVTTCRKALQRTGDNTRKEVVSDFYAIMGDAFHSLKRDNEAYAAYDSALVFNPDNIGALNNYAYYLSLQRKNLDKAEEMSYKTIKAEPKNATYLDTYAWILFEKGNYAQAKIYIDEALKSDEEKSADILEHCGDIYYKCGEREKAVDFWLQALDKKSTSPTLERKIKEQKYIPPYEAPLNP